VTFHPSGNYLLTANSDSTVKIWDLREGQLLYNLHGHDDAITAAAFSRDGSLFSSGSKDSMILVWNSKLDVQDQQVRPLFALPPPLFHELHPVLPSPLL
jgi:centriolar protein POC1